MGFGNAHSHTRLMGSFCANWYSLDTHTHYTVLSVSQGLCQMAVFGETVQDTSNVSGPVRPEKGCGVLYADAIVECCHQLETLDTVCMLWWWWWCSGSVRDTFWERILSRMRTHLHSTPPANSCVTGVPHAQCHMLIFHWQKGVEPANAVSASVAVAGSSTAAIGAVASGYQSAERSSLGLYTKTT